MVKYEDGNLAKIDQLEALRDSDKDEDKKSLEHLGKLINNLEKEMASLNELKAKKGRGENLDEKDQQLFDLLSKYNAGLVNEKIEKYRDFNDDSVYCGRKTVEKTKKVTGKKSPKRQGGQGYGFT